MGAESEAFFSTRRAPILCDTNGNIVGDIQVGIEKLLSLFFLAALLH